MQPENFAFYAEIEAHFNFCDFFIITSEYDILTRQIK